MIPPNTDETAAALIEKYGALQNPREVVHLIEYLRDDPPKLIIEVGVWRGGNAAILKTFFPDARYIGVDILTVDSPEVSDAPALRDAVAEFGLEMVHGNTNDPSTGERVHQMIGDERADYLFVDASHDTDSVIKDFNVWSPYTKRVGFHDVHNPMVYAAWIEICGFFREGPRSAALWKEVSGHGIGLVLT